jgi:glutamate/tyrosine decarboxylase-like PLP-dependent enzyme
VRWGRRLERALTRLERRGRELATRFGFVRDRVEAEYQARLAGLVPSLKPYRDELPRNRRLPPEGRAREDVLSEMRRMAEREAPRAEGGWVSGAVYHGDRDYSRFLAEVYALHLHHNPLHVDVWPSLARYEAEIVQMTAALLGADPDDHSEGRVCGAVSSGGSESILLAVKTYRDRARARRGVHAPELVVPATAHAAFDKACEYFGVKKVTVDVGPDLRADVRDARRALGRNTIAIVGSAPSFPHGVIDPIEELSELARARGIGFHTDACLGGFLLPFAERLGHRVPRFDFRLPGVTSLSADTHKYGFAPKGTSVILYRGLSLRRFQYFAAADWPGGLYASPTCAGSRPGALSAGCWAAMMAHGEAGYLAAARQILAAAAKIRRGIETTPGLLLLGDPLFVLAFAAEEGLDVYRVLDRMAQRGWSLNGLHRPACVHVCVTLRHAQPGVAERFVADLADATKEARALPGGEAGGMAPLYGMAGTLPFRGLVGELMTRYLDLLYEA